MDLKNDWTHQKWKDINNTNGIDLNDFVDISWDVEEHKIVVEYLNSFDPIIVCPGVDWCRFRCKKKVITMAYYDDGEYSWSNEIIHYVEYHKVKLPEYAIKHIIKNKDRINISEDSRCINCLIDLTNQKTYLTPGFNGQLWLLPSSIKPSKISLKFLRQFYELRNLSTVQLIELIKSNQKVMLDRKIHYADCVDLIRLGLEIGIFLEFLEES